MPGEAGGGPRGARVVEKGESAWPLLILHRQSSINTILHLPLNLLHVVGMSISRHSACCVRGLHKGCAGPYPKCIVVPSTKNSEPCYAFT